MESRLDIMNKIYPRKGMFVCAALLAAVMQAGTASAECSGMALHAHRGAPDSPENSLSGIRSASGTSWDGVEVDLQQLRSKEWVLHHDVATGRTITLANKRVADIDEKAWSETRLKGRNGAVTGEKPAMLADVLTEMKGRAPFVLNAEIKQVTACPDVHKLVAVFNRALQAGNWFLTSIDREHLRCAREVDMFGYYGQIVLDNRSLANSMKKRSRYVSAASSPKIDEEWLTKLVNEVGHPVGVHVDIATLSANPDLLKDAAKLNVSVFTYSLDGDIEHAKALRSQSARTSKLPSGAILDGNPKVFCDSVLRGS